VKALVAEGDSRARRALRWLLEDDGLVVEAVGDDTYLVRLAEQADVVVVDMGMHGSGDLTVLEQLHSAGVRTPVVAYSPTAQPGLRVAAEMLGARAFVATIGEPSALRRAVGLAASPRW
jgi:CheY-like chemotaxis protein